MKIVCAYSGGLDTSCMIPWLKEHYDAEIIAYTGDLGQGEDLGSVRSKALETGATHAIVEDLRERFVTEFVFPARIFSMSSSSFRVISTDSISGTILSRDSTMVNPRSVTQISLPST